MLTSDDKNWLRLLAECAVKSVVKAINEGAMDSEDAAREFRETFKERARPLWPEHP
jgi:hypothetical protein